MSKIRTTISEQSVKDCFIEIREKESFKSITLESNDTNNENEVDAAVSNTTAAALSIIRNNARRKASEILEDTENSESSEIPKIQKPGAHETENKIRDDDKSDYETESFCSDDSFKGSEVTNVTPRSSLSGCSSLLNSAGLKYDERITDLIKSRKSGDRFRRDDENDDEGFSFIESELKYLSEEERTLIINNRRQLTRSGRRNMSFTNEELRRIERENQLLLKKIMSHQKPQNKYVNKPNSSPPRTSSSAINRKRQQKKIEEDNMTLLRRLQQAKPCAMPRTSAPSFRLTGISNFN